MATVDLRVLLMMVGSGDRLCAVVVTDPFLPDHEYEHLEALVAVRRYDLIEIRTVRADRVDAVVEGLLGGRTEVVWSAISSERVVMVNGVWGDGQEWLKRLFTDGFPATHFLP